MSETAGVRSAKILLVEDEPAVARLTELLLENAGYEVTLTTDHAAVPALIAATAYDIVITDTDLGPHTVGLDRLARIVSAAQCPTLLFSAHRFSAAEVAAAGFAGTIPKPFDIDDLLRVVEDALSGRLSAPTDGSATATPSTGC